MCNRFISGTKRNTGSCTRASYIVIYTSLWQRQVHHSGDGGRAHITSSSSAFSAWGWLSLRFAATSHHDGACDLRPRCFWFSWGFFIPRTRDPWSSISPSSWFLTSSLAVTSLAHHKYAQFRQEVMEVVAPKNALSQDLSWTTAWLSLAERKKKKVACRFFLPMNRRRRAARAAGASSRSVSVTIRHSPRAPLPCRGSWCCSAAMEYASFLHAHNTITTRCGLASERGGEGPSVSAPSAGCDSFHTSRLVSWGLKAVSKLS